MQITDTNLANGWIDSLTRSSGGTLLSLTRTYLDNAGRTVKVDTYTNLTGVSYSATSAGPFGTKDTNYTETTYAYDSNGNQNQVTDDRGNVSLTDFNALGQPIDQKVNGITLETDQYDNGKSGDGDLTKVTDYPGTGPNGVQLAPQVTDYFDDWKDDQVATEQGVGSGGDVASVAHACVRHLT